MDVISELSAKRSINIAAVTSAVASSVVKCTGGRWYPLIKTYLKKTSFFSPFTSDRLNRHFTRSDLDRYLEKHTVRAKEVY